MALGDKEGLHGPIRREEGLHIDDEVLLQGQALDGFNGDGAVAEILDQGLTGQAIAPVDAHGVRAANAMSAGAPEREGPVLLTLDLHERIQHAVGGIGRYDVLLPVRLLVELRDETPHLDGDVLGLDTSGDLGCFDGGSHQYLRSIGW